MAGWKTTIGNATLSGKGHLFECEMFCPFYFDDRSLSCEVVGVFDASHSSSSYFDSLIYGWLEDNDSSATFSVKHSFGYDIFCRFHFGYSRLSVRLISLLTLQFCSLLVLTVLILIEHYNRQKTCSRCFRSAFYGLNIQYTVLAYVDNAGI